ncbi:hypothetical protein M501DRAFT_1047682 [Patellaria atrata CBS 101060]|uniref:Rho-GAP domain-containing protein n=1 Tax=Patellaria atrata CBS 101060 TaxID=1346257 RepID=A0A9P4SD95_9PEZI|nr:hypothetical protein M501DRAFT_1047682 [Patellaria atrata CBS 101060]
MRSHIASRLRSSSLSAVPPPQSSSDYSISLATAAASILYRSPIPSDSGHPIYILNAAAFPDVAEADYDGLLPYVLARLPGEDELISGKEYEVIFFAGGGYDGAGTQRKNRPGWGWFIQAYHVLSRAMRKRLKKLYIVHERSWVRILVEMFSTIVSPKFRRKIVHVSTLSYLALHIPIENLLIPPSAYLHDRRLSPDIYAPYATGRRAYSAKDPFPKSKDGKTRLPRILRETTSFLILDDNVQTEGLFRIPPNAQLRGILREAYDRGQKFIVWKDNGVELPIPPYKDAEDLKTIIYEVDSRDAYSVHLAASLIKHWYAELRQPIFPHSVYRDIKTSFNDIQLEITLDKLTDLFSPKSEWSCLPGISREILIRHLFPLLAYVTKYSDQNQMSPENLAVCFAPAMLCGPDQLEDAKVSSIIRRILTAAIEQWPLGLRSACGKEDSDFQNELHLPEDPKEWEDPLVGTGYSDATAAGTVVPVESESQFTGIIMEDNDAREEGLPPPLPPRPRAASPARSSGTASQDSLKRKPAPEVTVPPRYSTIIYDNPPDMAESPVSYGAVADGFGPRRSSGFSFSEDKKSGTHGSSESSSIYIPKRGSLTTEQKPKADNVGAALQSSTSESHTQIPLHGLMAQMMNANNVKRKPLSSTASPILPSGEWGPPENAESTVPFEDLRNSESTKSPEDFKKPSWPASARKPSNPIPGAAPPSLSAPDRPRAPTINSLARPVYPANTPAPQLQPSQKSSTIPLPSVPRRVISPGLLNRMPSFEPKGGKTTPPQTLVPRKLNLKKQSVDDLRRLYEERAGTARTLVELEIERRGSVKGREGSVVE